MTLQGDKAGGSITEGPPFPTSSFHVEESPLEKPALPFPVWIAYSRAGVMCLIGVFGKKNGASKAQSLLEFSFPQNVSV